MTHSLKDAINEFFQNHKIQQKVADHSISNNWDEVVGKKIAAVTKIKNVRNKILYIRTKTPAWRTELTFHRQEIMDKIKEKSPHTNFKEIRFI